MEISLGNLLSLFQTFEMTFQKGFEQPPTHFEKISMVTKSGSSQNLYPWLGRTTKFREWLGPRVLEMLEAHGYVIVNKDYEDTVGVKRNDIEDDTYGVYTPIFEQLGWDAKVHPDTLVFGLIKEATTNADSGTAPAQDFCFDGTTFFSANHPVGLSGNTTAVSNLDTSGGGNPYWYLVDASRPVRPFIFQKRREYTMTRMNTLTDEAVFSEKLFRFGVDCRVNVGWGLWQLCYASNTDLTNPANFEKAIAAMRSIKTDAGLPFGAWSGTANKYLLVPPVLEGAGRRILNSEFIVGTGAGGPSSGVPGVASSNVWKGTADLIVSEYLA